MGIKRYWKETGQVPSEVGENSEGDYVRYDELVAEVREWAAYCRSCQPGPNIADTMLEFIGDAPHDYTSDATTGSQCPHYCVESGFCQKCGEDVSTNDADGDAKHG